MKIGIIGAENSHTVAIARTINIDKQVKGASVDYVWGETAEFAKAAAKDGQIPNIVARSDQMLGKIDALIVDHRHAKYHLKAALPYVKKGVPSFIDKPFCYRGDEGKAFLKLARKCGAPVTSFSVLTHQASFGRMRKKMESLGDIVAGVTYGPCDLKSQWGGVFFYGIHQVDMVLVAFGYDVKSVLVTKNGNGATGQMIYPDGKIVTMQLIKQGVAGFSITAAGNNGTIHQAIAMDKNSYLHGIKTFTTMFKTGVAPLGDEQILKPVLVLEALERSVKSGKVEKVGR